MTNEQVSTESTTGLKLDPERAAMGARARARRQQMGMSSKAAADALGLTYANFIRIERQLHRARREDLESRWEEVLKVPPGWLRDPETLARAKSNVINLSGCDTAAAVIRAMGCYLASPRLSRRSTNPARLNADERRLANAFAERYGVMGPGTDTLQSVGDRYGVTRERIRQIVAKMLNRSQGMQIQAPVMQQLHETAQPLLPANLPTLDAKLKPLLGESLSVLDADRFAREVMGMPLMNFTDKPGDMVYRWDIAAYAPETHEPETVRAIREHAIAMIRNCGAAQLYYIAGAASEVLGKGVSPEETLKACQLVPGFEWLIEDDRWFWFGPETPMQNRILSVAKKVLAVANRRVDVEDLVQALGRSRHTRVDRSIRPVMIEPPPPLIKAVLEHQPWVKRIQHDDFIADPPIPPKEVLSDGELLVYQSLLQLGGIASKQELAKMVLGKGIIKEIAFTLILGTSPAITRLDFGLFVIRGFSFNKAAAARALGQLESGPNHHVQIRTPDRKGWIEHKIKLSDYVCRNKVFSIPKGLALALGEDLATFNLDGSKVVLRRNDKEHPRLTGLVPELIRQGYAVGDVIKVRINPAECVIECSKLAAATRNPETE